MNIAIHEHATDDQRAEVLRDAALALASAVALADGRGERRRVLRILHTVKGAVAFLDLPDLAASLHELEGLLDTGAAEDLLADAIRDAEASLAAARAPAPGGRPGPVDGRSFASCLWWAERMLAQLTASLGKRARLEVEGSATEIDETRAAGLTAALQHLVRNAVVHGVEWPEQRRARGKPEEGCIFVSAHLGADGRLTVEVADDGAGLPESLSDRVFQPGVSGAADVSLYAGRGLGLDAVLAEADALGGSVDVSSEPGKGAVFTLRLPPLTGG